MAEAITRSGRIRYGNAFMGQVLSDYLGPAASVALSSGIGLLCFFVLQAYYIGFATTLSEASGIPPWLFTIILFGLGMYYVSRETLLPPLLRPCRRGVNIAIILFVSALAFTQLNPGLLRFGRESLRFFLLELIFGVISVRIRPFIHLQLRESGSPAGPSGRSSYGEAWPLCSSPPSFTASG